MGLKRICIDCGHYEETHHDGFCDGWMPGGAGHHRDQCDCVKFRAATSRSPDRTTRHERRRRIRAWTSGAIPSLTYRVEGQR